MKFRTLKTTNPRKISFAVSFLHTLFVSILYLTASFLFPEIKFNLFVLLIFNTAIFIFSFFLFEYILKRFIYDKIRLIYKTIRNLKLQKNEKPEVDLKGDIIKEVKDEVEEWSKEHEVEISTLKERETFRREYIGNISHELKNPIFNIQGYIYSLINGAIDDKKLTTKYLKRTNKNIERIIDILEDLDTISELERINLKPDFKKFDILQLAKDVNELFIDKTSDKNIKLFFREDYTNPIYAFGNKKKIKQVFINLIDNAIKYSSKNGKIKISFFDMDKNYLIEITDEGPGISENDLPRIFERFYRTDKARSRDKGGTGLGLAIVKHIIEAHKQTINVRSTTGVGTTFAFTISKA
ncbi:MAG: ATP-binding protein [Bacteroidales bacterium]|nr:ATP-binding protein [Bacteroidales bacterium]